MLNKTFKFHTDPGHGWLAVKIADLPKVGLSLNDVSHYSMVKGKTVYLEEDCDATLFIEAFEKTFGARPTMVEAWHPTTSHPIRYYPRLAQIRNLTPEQMGWKN